MLYVKLLFCYNLVPQLSDGDEEQVTTHFLQAAFPIEQFDDTTFSITDRTRGMITAPFSLSFC